MALEPVMVGRSRPEGGQTPGRTERDPGGQGARRAGPDAGPGDGGPACAPGSSSAAGFTARHGLRYGALGLPLAFVALPLYVLLPPHYAAVHGAPLVALGGVLLASRLFDALLDPALGRLADHLLDRGPHAAWRAAAAGCGAIAIGFALLFTPPALDTAGLLAWLGAGLLWTTLAYSGVSILHQAWGARLGGDAAQRARVVGWREGAALLGVLIASVLPAVAGLALTSAVLTVLLAAGVALLACAPRPAQRAVGAKVRLAIDMEDGQAGRQQVSHEQSRPIEPRAGTPAVAPVAQAVARPVTRPRPVPSRGGPWRQPAFRSLLAVFMLSGIASAVPATLVLFVVRDRLQAPAWEPAFLGSYFLAAALSVPAWLRLVPRLGLAGGWAAGMGLAIAGFAGVGTLGAGDAWLFLAVCIVTGAALGADLTFPGALLAGLVRRAGHGGTAEGAYFGWWQAAAKLNLALAAGLALPLLAAAGYTPGARSAQALWALMAAYAGLPLLLKAAALALLLRHRARHGEDR